MGYGGFRSKYMYIDIYIDQTFDLIGLFNTSEVYDTYCETCPSAPYYGYNDSTDKDKRISNNSSDYYSYGSKVKTITNSKLDNYITYDPNNPYQTNFDIKKESYINYLGISIDGRSRITTQSNTNTVYTVDANMDGLIGTTGQTTGLLYNDNIYSGTNVSFIGEGWNQLNTNIKPIYREPENFGLIWPTEIYSDVFINRSKYNVTERHLRLSEFNTTEDIKNYYNGYYKILQNGF
jgi:hypothetical protein